MSIEILRMVFGVSKCFFFSSRRRHTRFDCDWSSDVCSSDLLKEALRGGREERSILVRDRNRIIAAGVLKNPRLTDMEVESFASLRSLHEDILRIIGQSREWMRCYPIVLKLVRNPKTPAGIALNHLPRLQTRDLQNLVRDHNVPEAIRRMARRQSDAREKKVSFTRGKH